MEKFDELSIQPKDDSDLDDDVMVIGIDFGTTYSGAAWATKADFESNQINLITSWPDYGPEEGKTPTELFYEDDQIHWGYGIPNDGDPVRWFKLLLLRDEDIQPPELRCSEFILRARKMLRDMNKTAEDLVADYLRLLWRHVCDAIARARGEDVVDALVFQVVITVPAIWKGYARQAMGDAAKKAGILEPRAAGQTTLAFAPEPEAAAFSTLCEPGRRPKKDEVYVICDAGGGTVDLISYKITSTSPLIMEEAVEGTGGLCGGIFIDEKFENVCKARLGRRWERLSKAGIKELMKGEWEKSIKPQFRPGNPNKEYIVSIPTEAFSKGGLDVDDMTKEPHIKRGRIHFKQQHIRHVYTEVFDGILELIDGQVKKAKDEDLKVAGIILVGGLGGSRYLHSHLVSRYRDQNISILQDMGMKPRTAICRGAVYKGFLDSASIKYDANGHIENYAAPIQVTSTIARASYGVLVRHWWDEKKYLEEDKEWDNIEGGWKAENQLSWYIKRGEHVSKTQKSEEFYRIVNCDFDGSFYVEMMHCEDEEPPTRKTSSVKEWCRIDCRLDEPVSSLEDFASADGFTRKRMPYIIAMRPSGATAKCSVYLKGRESRLGKNQASIVYK